MGTWYSYMDIFNEMKQKLGQCSDDESPSCEEKITYVAPEMVHGATCIECSILNKYVEIEKGKEYVCYSCKSYKEM